MSRAAEARWVLGVDGGGTKTIAWITACENGSARTDPKPSEFLRATGSSGPSNPYRVGWEVAFQHLAEAITHAQANANANLKAPVSIDSACLAIAGLGAAPDRLRVQQWAEQFSWGQRVTVMDDGRVLLNASGRKPLRHRVVLICGTGTMAIGTDTSGEICRSGGWGETWGDVGSGQWLALSALRHVTRWFDRRAEGEAFAKAILNDLQLSEIDSFRLWLRRVEPGAADVRALAPRVQQLADAGDPTAIELRNEAATALAELVVSVLRQLCHEQDRGLNDYELILAGGWLAADPHLVKLLMDELRQHVGLPFETTVAQEPVECAVRCAMFALPDA